MRDVLKVVLFLTLIAVVGIGGLLSGVNQREKARGYLAVGCDVHQASVLCQTFGCEWHDQLDVCHELPFIAPGDQAKLAAPNLGSTATRVVANDRCGRPLSRRPCHTESVCSATAINGCQCPDGSVGDGIFCAVINSRESLGSTDNIKPRPPHGKYSRVPRLETPVCARSRDYWTAAVKSPGTSPKRLAATAPRFKALISLARQQSASAKSGSVILTISSEAYRGALINWLFSVVSIRADNYLIVATDKAMHDFLDLRHIPHYFCEGDADAIAKEFNLTEHGRLAKIWAYRYAVLRALLVAGITVVQSDVDALFLRDPLPRLQSLMGDVLAQRGNFPFNMAKTWGATLCFGFIVYRATPATVAWFDLSFPKFISDPDDQVSFQRALNTCSRVVWNHGHTWPATKALYQSLRPRPFGAGNQSTVDYGVTEQPVTTNGTRLRIVMLPFAEFPRKCGKEVGFPEKQRGCYLAHCVAPKSGSSKVIDSRRRGLMFLKPDWENELPKREETVQAFIRRLGNGVHPLSQAKPEPVQVKPIPKTQRRTPRAPPRATKVESTAL